MTTKRGQSTKSYVLIEGEAKDCSFCGILTVDNECNKALALCEEEEDARMHVGGLQPGHSSAPLRGDEKPHRFEWRREAMLAYGPDTIADAKSITITLWRPVLRRMLESLICCMPVSRQHQERVEDEDRSKTLACIWSIQAPLSAKRQAASLDRSGHYLLVLNEKLHEVSVHYIPLSNRYLSTKRLIALQAIINAI
ncbi:uncharacterized protein MYCFIDRAFT_207760 [Pseudocercospora fijiensis CIRAD86]|uniref:Uncharacterized protein n=1 Tax=Pseudocercospora fijiensis (strain CIRAD86) TaxID=383855 RepID=M3AFE3_PSEFD|nr:uncharacterized protein MYCFIDRAFT_207760 [Pseudocercospora fijiensis CIRAD86]EME83301.1 hypothetical protein MYCFIDRAFT_207760 [Pseudocercospora fijiensis CIRAD86]